MRLVDQSNDVAGQLLATATAVMHEQPELLLTAAGHCAVLQIHEVVGARVLVHQSDERRAPAGKAARGQAGLKLQALGCGQHAGAGLGPDIGLVVQHARDRLDGLGYIMYRLPCHALRATFQPVCGPQTGEI